MIKTLLSIILTIFIVELSAQSASVSPSRLYYKVAPGGYKSQAIKVTNNGDKLQTFKVDFADFNAPGNKGKTEVMKEGESNERGCSKWLSASPSFFEIATGGTKDIEILLQLPNTPEANKARWAVGIVKLTQENVGGGEKGSDVVGMRIIQSFQFVIHIFQTPPSVVYKEASVIKFYRDTLASDSAVSLKMEVANTGETIIDCAPYLDVINTANGEKTNIKVKGFTVLPGGEREIRFYLPADIKKGKYNILGVVDYGSDTDIAGAELNIIIK